ncbi:MAG: hypothetical protein GY699_19845 [Desulfobacteraceae bacterium]|nr:hypothetical protein [Desulfobacteraceae bacterium]
MKKILIILLTFFIPVVAYSTELNEKTFQLNYSFSLKVMEQEDLSAIVEISSDEQAYHIVTIENAAIGEVKKVKLCKSCKDSFFIALYDRSSTYGSTTGIVAWQNGWDNWYLMVLPFSVAGIEDEDNDGVFELVDQYSEKTENKFYPVKMKYMFRDGLIWPE